MLWKNCGKIFSKIVEKMWITCGKSYYLIENKDQKVFHNFFKIISFLEINCG